ncbi:hypothetical protein TUM12370_09360 [Salmonella enterica subsp. enterica serovar Choleraesuis]|nr:hypothetical protein TUM12370_09360 [Salmonella enterica subsp. enterica serovar Choleraesuis]
MPASILLTLAPKTEAVFKSLEFVLTQFSQRILSASKALVDVRAKSTVNGASLQEGSGQSQATDTLALVARVKNLRSLQMPTPAELLEQAAAGEVESSLPAEQYQLLAQKAGYQAEQVQQQITGAIFPLEKMSTLAGMLENKFTGQLAQNLTNPLENLSAIVQDNLPEIEGFLDALANKIGERANDFVSLLPDVLDMVIGIKDAFGGWGPLLDALEKAAVFGGLLNGLSKVASVASGAVGTVKSLMNLGSKLPQSVKAIASEAIDYSKNVASSLWEKSKDIVQSNWKKFSSKGAEKAKDVASWGGRQASKFWQTGRQLSRQVAPVADEIGGWALKRGLPLMKTVAPFALRLGGIAMFPLSLLIPDRELGDGTLPFTQGDFDRLEWRQKHPDAPFPPEFKDDPLSLRNFDLPLKALKTAVQVPSWLNGSLSGETEGDTWPWLKVFSPQAGNSKQGATLPWLDVFSPQARSNIGDAQWLFSQQPGLTSEQGRPATISEIGGISPSTSVSNNIEQTNQFNIYQASDPQGVADSVTSGMFGAFSQMNEMLAPGSY